jgi:hypothetical protein
MTLPSYVHFTGPQLDTSELLRGDLVNPAPNSKSARGKRG